MPANPPYGTISLNPLVDGQTYEHTDNMDQWKAELEAFANFNTGYFTELNDEITMLINQIGTYDAARVNALAALSARVQQLETLTAALAVDDAQIAAINAQIAQINTTPTIASISGLQAQLDNFWLRGTDPDGFKPHRKIGRWNTQQENRLPMDGRFQDPATMSGTSFSGTLGRHNGSDLLYKDSIMDMILNPFNGLSDPVEAGQVIYNSSFFGGTAPAMNATAQAFANGVASIVPYVSAVSSIRYGPSYYISEVAAGSGTSTEVSGHAGNYRMFSSSRSGLWSTNGALTLAMYCQPVDEDVILELYNQNSTSSVYVNGVEKYQGNGNGSGANYEVLTAGNVYHVCFSIGPTSIGYNGNGVRVFTQPGNRFRYANAVVFGGIYHIEPHTVIRSTDNMIEAA